MFWFVLKKKYFSNEIIFCFDQHFWYKMKIKMELNWFESAEMFVIKERERENLKNQLFYVN